MLALLLISAVGGVLTVLSPCVLPVLPGLLAGSAGEAGEARDRWRPAIVVLGLAISFLVVGIVFTIVGAQVGGISPTALRWVGVVMLAAFGVLLLVPSLSSRVLGGLTRFAPTQSKGRLGALLLGASLGLVWAPCAGPILGFILTLAIAQHDLAQSSVLLVSYVLGAAVPMLAIGYGGRALFLKLRGTSLAASDGLKKALGVLLLLSSAAISTGLDLRILARVPSFLPSSLEQRVLDVAMPPSEQPTIAVTPNVQMSETRSTTSGTSSLPNLGPAPELTGITGWHNSPPLTLAALRGKVVLVDFWTYSCINCIHTLPHLRALYDAYEDQGLVIVGVHSPEFAFEAIPENIAQASEDLGVTWPVAYDPDFATWRAYNNRYWPAHYLIDRDGYVRQTHFGEGAYDETEQAVRALLATPATAPRAKPAPVVGSGGRYRQTPETYLGAARARSYPTGGIAVGTATFADAPSLDVDQVGLTGTWTVEDERITAGAGATLRLHFRGRGVFLVIASPKPARVGVRLDDAPVDGRLGPDVAATKDVEAGTASIVNQRLYHLIELPAAGEGTVELSPDVGVSFYAFTFE